jgi:hypothetical protein
LELNEIHTNIELKEIIDQDHHFIILHEDIDLSLYLSNHVKMHAIVDVRA